MNLSHNAQQILSSPCYCTACTFCAEFKQIHLQTCRRVHTGYTLSLSTVHCVFIYAHTPNPHRICHDWMTVCPYTFHTHTHRQRTVCTHQTDGQWTNMGFWRTVRFYVTFSTGNTGALFTLTHQPHLHVTHMQGVSTSLYLHLGQSFPPVSFVWAAFQISNR